MFKQALEFYQVEKYNDAIELWEKVLVVEPDHKDAKEHISMAKAEIAKMTEEKKKKQEEMNRKKAQELFSKAVAFYKRKEWQKAKDAFEESKKLDPSRDETEEYINKVNTEISAKYYAEGLKYYEEKKLEDAIEKFRSAAKLNPSDNAVKADLSEAEAELKEIKSAKAEECSRKGLKEYGLGNLEKAVELWERALSYDPENAKIQNNLNRAKNELKKK
jgi:tetratricopeptide (TPR) repeat protein